MLKKQHMDEFVVTKDDDIDSLRKEEVGMSVDIGIDLGTASVLVYVKGKGVILKEPSVVAYDRDTNAIKAIGEEARLMLGRTPGNIVAVRPLRQGVISDYTVTEKMNQIFCTESTGKKNFQKAKNQHLCAKRSNGSRAKGCRRGNLRSRSQRSTSDRGTGGSSYRGRN